MNSVNCQNQFYNIYVHGNRQLIEQGEDNKGKFYKMYYKEET